MRWDSDQGGYVLLDINYGKELEILLVEDNPGDIRLTQEAFKESGINYKLHVATDGNEAVNFLNREAEYANAPVPSIIILDLNLPKRDGREVLKMIKTHQSLRKIPVVILTTSKSEEDIFHTYDQHANCYITKPVDLDQFITVIQSIKHFWLSVVKLPN